MDNDNPLHDTEPTAELPALTEMDLEAAAGKIAELGRNGRRSPRRSETAKDTEVAGDHENLSSRLRKAVNDYVEQEEKLRAVSKELAEQMEQFRTTSDALDQAATTIRQRDELIEEKSKQIEHLEVRAKELDEEVGTLKIQMAALEESLGETEAQSRKHIEERSELEAALERAQLEFESQLELARNEVGKYSERLNQERARISELETSVAELAESRQTHQSEREALTNKLAEVEAKLRSNAGELTAAQEKCERQADELKAGKERQTELHRYRDEVATLSTYIDNRKLAWLEMQEKAKAREARIKILESEVEQTFELRRKLVEFGDRINEFEESAQQYTLGMSPQELENELLELRDRNEAVEAELASARENSEREIQLADDNGREIAELQKLNERLRKELTAAQAIVEQKSALVKEKATQLRSASRDLKRTRKQCTSLQRKLEKSAAESASAREALQEAEASTTEAHSRIAELESEVGELTQARDKQTEDLQTAEQLLAEARELASGHKDALQRKAEQLETREAELAEAHNVIDNEAERIKTLDEQLREHTQKLEDAGEQLAQAQLEHASIEHEKSQLEAELERCKESEQHTSSELEELKTELNEAQDEVERLRHAHEEARAVDEKRDDELRDTRAEAQRLRETLQARDKELEEQLGKLEMIDGTGESFPDFEATETLDKTSEYEALDEEEMPNLDEEVRAVPTLICFTSDTPRQYELRKRAVTIGRGSDCEIQLLTHFVSREHARLYNRDGVVTIEDLGSKNGIFVNSVRVESQMLQHGDWVTVGETQFRFIRAEN